MSDYNKISPLLDGFTLGASISEHHGVTCCPAIKENSSKKYIVKIISVPATQAQFDALLLAGAYKDPGDAMEYFRENGEYILQEAEILKTLSKIEGFLPYDGWQMEPIARRRLGYEVYLVGSYKRSLDKYIRKNAITHLEAVNLGLDLCAALSVCRQSGYLYADLKPSNIFVSEKKEYRIGDLGFLRLDSLRYTSLPERFFSPYTPPELLDPMAPINLSIDTYAVGMILYQLYNDGLLPFTDSAPLETLPSPCHADYEMAEIIMKAIHSDPEQRWSDPKDLGKAIASYMQRNSVNDIPITPFIPLDVKPEDIVVLSQASETNDAPDPDAAEPLLDEASLEETATEVPVQIPVDEEIPQDEEAVESNAASEETVPLVEEAIPNDDESVIGMDSEEADIPQAHEEEAVQPENTPAGSETKEEHQDDESLTTLSDEVAKIITKANDIIAHEIPDEALFPVEADIPDPFAFAKDDSEDLDDAISAESFTEEETQELEPEKKKKTKHFADISRKKKIKKFFSRCFTLLILCGLCIAGFWYYQNVYLQPIDSMSISGTQNQITVLVDTSVEESRLTVTCTDENGKRRTEALEGGKAVFTDLNPSTEYTIQITMSGFHNLVGETTEVFKTEATTQVLSMHAIAGSKDGSVMIDFTVDGEDPDFWNIRYIAEGEEERTETITGHSAMITGLTIGKVYTFTLDGGKNFDFGGKTSIQYLASRLILAENLRVSSSNGNEITVQWNAPGDVVVESWNVRFYDGYGFEEQVTVTENQVQFHGLDPESSYTVEITAAGMTQPAKITISAEPIIISDIKMDESSETEMTITWEYSGNAPEGGWRLHYTVDGSGSQTLPCTKASAVISPLIPGANYSIVLESADGGKTVFNNTVQHRVSEADAFSEHRFSAENISFHLLKTPENSDWHYETIPENSFTSTFHVGDPVSMVMSSSTDVYVPGNKTKSLFVFRDSYGNVLTDLVTEESFNWKNIWMAGDTKTAELNIPRLPETPGAYVLEIYFNGCFVVKFNITISD